MVRDTIEELCSHLQSLYPNGSEGLQHNNDFELFVSIVLAAQTQDKVTNEVVRNFPYKSFDELAKADRCSVLASIKRVGFAKNKAVYLIEGAKRIISQFGGQLPDTYEELISLPGIGDKSASYILWQKGIETRPVIDTHMKRVLSRILGLKKNDNIHEILKDCDSKLIGCLNRTIVQFGREICRARYPKCNVCPVKHICHYYKTQEAT